MRETEGERSLLRLVQVVRNLQLVLRDADLWMPMYVEVRQLGGADVLESVEGFGAQRARCQTILGDGRHPIIAGLPRERCAAPVWLQFGQRSAEEVEGVVLPECVFVEDSGWASAHCGGDGIARLPRPDLHGDGMKNEPVAARDKVAHVELQTKEAILGGCLQHVCIGARPRLVRVRIVEERLNRRSLWCIVRVAICKNFGRAVVSALRPALQGQEVARDEVRRTDGKVNLARQDLEGIVVVADRNCECSRFPVRGEVAQYSCKSMERNDTSTIWRQRHLRLHALAPQRDSRGG